MTNTLAIVGQDSAPGSAARVVLDFKAYGSSGWFLPSLDELNQLSVSISRLLRTSGGYYWTSTESGPNYAWAQLLDSGRQGSALKSDSLGVQPIRAF
jgi:hypothetical protein